MSETIEELLAEWAECGDGFEEGKMLRRLKAELDSVNTEWGLAKSSALTLINAAHESRDKLKAENERLRKERDDAEEGARQIHKEHGQACERWAAERDKLKGENERFREALTLILAESDNNKCNEMDSLITCVNIAEHALRGNP